MDVVIMLRTTGPGGCRRDRFYFFDWCGAVRTYYEATTTLMSVLFTRTTRLSEDRFINNKRVQRSCTIVT